MSSSTVYLVTGANRGLGLSFVTSLANGNGNADADSKNKHTNIVYATARDPDAAKELQAIADASDGRVKVLRADVTREEDLRKVKEVIEVEQGRVDVVLANAGHANSFVPVLDVDITEFRHHFEINTVAFLRLYQIFFPLLTKPASAGKFILLGSSLGSLAIAGPFLVAPYSVSKVGAHMLVRYIHGENAKDGVVAVAVHPGMVQTDMGIEFGVQTGREAFVAAGLTPDQSAQAVLDLVDGFTKDGAGGKFFNYDGSELPW